LRPLLLGSTFWRSWCRRLGWAAGFVGEELTSGKGSGLVKEISLIKVE